MSEKSQIAIFSSWNTVLLAVIEFNKIRRSQNKDEIATQDYIKKCQWFPVFEFKLQEINGEIDRSWLEFCREEENIEKFGIQFRDQKVSK